MRVVISGHETCGIIHDLSVELQARGHEVITVALPSKLFGNDYDYDQYAFLVSYATRRFGSPWLWSRISAGVWRLSKAAHNSLEKKMRIRMVRAADLYIRVWATIPFDREVLEAVQGTRTMVTSIFMGSDVRDFGAFAQEFEVPKGTVPSGTDDSIETKLNSLRTHEKLSDAIFSVPDQMGLALRPYHHLQVPLRLERFVYRVPAREIPRIVHAPSKPGIKGTEVIEATLAKLKDEGLSFDFISVRDMKHEQLLEILTDADVLVDELVGHGPGWLSFEAMASGCAVATRYLESSPACFRPPVVPINANNIYDRLRALLSDRGMRVRLAEEGRRYVEQHNSIGKVVDDLIGKTKAGRVGGTDYVPRFLLDSYSPASLNEANKINAMNDIVRNEDWYKGRIAGHRRGQLDF